MWVMGLADIVSQLTSLLATVAVFTLALSLPLVLLGRIDIPLLGLLLLLFAPSVSTILQLALSRSREFDADLGAAELTGDPAGLASALNKIERYQGQWLERMLWPGRGDPDPSLLRSHPDTKERILRLLDLNTNTGQEPYQELSTEPVRPRAWQEVSRPPRRRWTGVWY
jgi:heat shock protein HtpX